MELSKRQLQVGTLVARGYPAKRIAHELNLSVRTVQDYIENTAAKIPGNEPPRHRITLFFIQLESESAA